MNLNRAQLRALRDALDVMDGALAAMEAAGLAATVQIGGLPLTLQPVVERPREVPAAAPVVPLAPVPRRADPKPGKVTDEQRAEIARLAAEGLDARAIGERLGLLPKIVGTILHHVRLKAEGLPLNTRRLETVPSKGRPGRPKGSTAELTQSPAEIAAEQKAMEGLDDEAVVIFARARDAGQSIPAARMDALASMAKRRSQGASA